MKVQAEVERPKYNKKTRFTTYSGGPCFYSELWLANSISRGKAGRKGNLQVKAAGIAVHVQHLAGKVKAGYLFGFHGFGGNLLYLYAAAGYNRLLNGSEAFGGKGKGFDGFPQPLALLPGNLVYLCFPGDAAAAYYNGNHFAGQQQGKGIYKSFVLELGKIPQKAGV